MNKKPSSLVMFLLLTLAISIILAPQITLAATGGTITTDGTYFIHTFTTNGYFNVSANETGLNFTILIVAGGGSGAGYYGAGGGAGGLIYNTSYIISGNISVIVGIGGATNTANGLNGSNSSFGVLIAKGGGGGAGNDKANGYDGGSGGGTSAGSMGIVGQGIIGQGFNGSQGHYTHEPSSNGAGGGAGGNAQNAIEHIGGIGGIGINYSINGSEVCYAGGGGGSARTGGTKGTATCGGGNGSVGATNGISGINGTGGGGGGNGGGTGTGGAGGSGIVIIRYGSGGASSPPIEFYNQTPSDITSTNIIGNILNITYNVTNNTDMTRVYINYSFTSNGCYQIVNKTCIVNNDTYYQNENSSYAGTFYSFYFDDNYIYPATYNINETYLEAQTHDFTILSSSNQYALITLNNISIKKYGIFEVMANTTGSSTIIYCNSSFTFTNPITSNNCVGLGSINSTTFNHTHEGGLSKHQIFSFPINTSSGLFNGIGVTSTSYFLIRGGTGTTYIYNIPDTSGAYYYKNSTNSGSSWNNMSDITIDSHLHQSNGTQVFNYQGCVNKSGVVSCTSIRTDNLDITILPPTSPVFTNPINNSQTATSYFNVSWTPSIPFNASFTIQGYNLSLLNNDSSFNQTLNGNTSTNTSHYFDLYGLNLSVGSYKFKVVATSSNGMTSSAISPYINLNKNAILKINATYILTNQTINNFTINFTDMVTGITESNSTTTNTSTIEIIKNRNYTIVIDAPGYALSNITNTSFPLVYNNTYSFRLYTNNSVTINIYDETTSAIITQNISITFTQGLTQIVNSTTTGTYYQDGLSEGSWDIKFIGTNYSLKTYTISVANQSTQTLNVYLTTSDQTTIFTILDFDTSRVLEGASVTQSRLINGSYTITNVKSSDITGRVQLIYVVGAKYQFLVTLTGYDSNLFYLDPILFSTYNIRMTKTTTLAPENTPDYTSIDINFYNNLTGDTTWIYNRTNTIVWIISSPIGSLDYYNLNLSYPGGNHIDNGILATGEQFTIPFNITSANSSSKVIVAYCYKSTTSYQKCFSFPYSIIGAYDNTSMIANKNNTYGLSVLERVIIVTIIVIAIGGFFFMVGGLLPGMLISVLIMSFFVTIGFTSLWMNLPSLFIGIIILMRGDKT